MKKILFFAFAATMLMACSKENTIKKNLYSGDGIWDISKIEETTTATPGEEIKTVRTDAGFVKFNEDGTGEMVTKVDSNKVTSSMFTYYNTATEMISISNGDGRIYDLSWAKNRIVLKWVDEGYFYNPNINDTVHNVYKVEVTCNKRK